MILRHLLSYYTSPDVNGIGAIRRKSGMKDGWDSIARSLTHLLYHYNVIIPLVIVTHIVCVQIILLDYFVIKFLTFKLDLCLGTM